MYQRTFFFLSNMFYVCILYICIYKCSHTIISIRMFVFSMRTKKNLDIKIQTTNQKNILSTIFSLKLLLLLLYSSRVERRNIFYRIVKYSIYVFIPSSRRTNYRGRFILVAFNSDAHTQNNPKGFKFNNNKKKDNAFITSTHFIIERIADFGSISYTFFFLNTMCLSIAYFVF